MTFGHKETSIGKPDHYRNSLRSPLSNLAQPPAHRILLLDIDQLKAFSHTISLQLESEMEFLQGKVLLFLNQYFLKYILALVLTFKIIC